VRKLKKFKRYAEGGALGAGEGDPFSYTDFSNRERNLRKPSEAAPIEERDTSRKTPEPPKEERLTQPEPAKAGTERVQKPAVTTTDTTPKDRGETDFNYEPQRPYNQALEDAKEQGRRARDAFKPAKPAAAKSEKDVKYSGDAINVSSGASGFKFPDKSPAKTKSAGPEDIPGTDVKTPYKGETIDNSNLPAKQFAQSMLGATAVGRVVSPAIRGAAMVGRMLESPRAEGKGTGKFPESETKEAATAAAKQREEALAKSRERQEALSKKANEDIANYRAAQEQAKSGTKEAPKAKPTADNEVAQEAAKRAAASRPRVTPKRQEDSAKFGGGKGTPSKVKARAEMKPTGKKFDKPVGEKEGPTVDKVLESKGLAAKKGGKIPAFKKGGLVSRGDGCAQRGKTKCRMV